MLLEPEKAGTDYFQTIPAARMIVSKYEDMKLDKVMVASGAIYNLASATTGDVYSGDMRENTAKSTFSTGINLANWRQRLHPGYLSLCQAFCEPERGRYYSHDRDAAAGGRNSFVDATGARRVEQIPHVF